MPTSPNPLRILVVTRSYPSADDLYQYPFVHRRVLAYIAAGHEVAVFKPSEALPSRHDYQGVTCWTGGADTLRAFTDDWMPDVIAAHGFSEAMWPFLEPMARSYPIRAWLHGSEIPDFFRQKARWIADEKERDATLRAVEQRCAFWNHLLGDMPENLQLVFVSNSAVELAQEDWGDRLRDWVAIPNPIDTDLFAYRPKVAEDRFNILMIRPFDNPSYGNDLAVRAIELLSLRPGFDRLTFTIIGDGPLFDETLLPIRHLENVTIERRFLSQTCIADAHRRHGIFLVPTRLDTHGVSRDEAMSSGLVPVTNAVSAVPEFADETCAALAPADDPEALADALWQTIADPQLFLRRSSAAAARVRSQSGNAMVIPAELALLGAAKRG
jgi:glycosyltransferase involved in cell wall biosynthesis